MLGDINGDGWMNNGDIDAFVALPNREEGEMGPRLATTLVMNPDITFDREIIYPGPP